MIAYNELFSRTGKNSRTVMSALRPLAGGVGVGLGGTWVGIPRSKVTKARRYHCLIADVLGPQGEYLLESYPACKRPTKHHARKLTEQVCFGKMTTTASPNTQPVFRRRGHACYLALPGKLKRFVEARPSRPYDVILFFVRLAFGCPSGGVAGVCMQVLRALRPLVKIEAQHLE